MAMTPIVFILLISVSAESQAPVPGLFHDISTMEYPTTIAGSSENMHLYTDSYNTPPDALLEVGSGAGDYSLSASDYLIHGLPIDHATTTRNGPIDNPTQSLEQSDPTGRLRYLRLPLPTPPVLAKPTDKMDLFNQDKSIQPMGFAEKTFAISDMFLGRVLRDTPKRGIADLARATEINVSPSTRTNSMHNNNMLGSIQHQAKRMYHGMTWLVYAPIGAATALLIYITKVSALTKIAILVGSAMSISAISMMMPGGTAYSQRQPPLYNPEDRSQTFRAWVTDLMHWVMLTDLAPHQQATSIVSRLDGTARDMGMTLTPEELFNGGVVNGQQLDPVTYIVAGLHRNFSQLDAEVRMAAMTEFMAFQRRRDETISSTIARYELVRNRARGEGNFDMSIEGCALQLLKAVQCTASQMV